MTRGDLIRHVGLELGLDRTASSEEQLLMVDWANKAVQDVLIQTHCRVEIGDISVAANVEDLRLDDEILALDERTISANTVKLNLVSPEEIFDLRRASGIATSPDVTRLSFQGDLLLIWPKPTSAATIRVVFVQKPTPMTNDAHDTAVAPYGSIPAYAEDALLSYMLWRGARYDERRAPHTPNDYKEMYKQDLAEVRRRMRRMGGRTNLQIKVGYPNDVTFPRRNDIYPAG